MFDAKVRTQVVVGWVLALGLVEGEGWVGQEAALEASVAGRMAVGLAR